MVTGSPVVARRWLGLELRRLRKQRGLTQQEVGRACGWSGARLSYLENGQQNVIKQDLDELLGHYDVPESQRARFYEAVNESQGKGWWEAYADVAPDYLLPFIGYEQGASQIRSFQLMVVPGSLQTPTYAASVLHHGAQRRTRRAVDRMVDLRMRRQEIVMRSDAPATFSAVIDEGVLYRAPGGEREVLVDQIRRLLELTAVPHIALHVLPFDRSIPELASGSFVILTLAVEDPDPDLVYVERRDGASYLEEFSDIESYLLAFDGLVDLSLSQEETGAMLQHALERLTR